MSRIEVISRGFLVIGLVVGLAAVGVIAGKQIFSESEAPKLEELGPLLQQGDVVYSSEREDLASKDGRPGRSVLMDVPQASNQEQARTGLLRLLASSGWTVSSRGGAIPPQGAVCLALSTSTEWLDETANADLSDEFREALTEKADVAVVVDMFYCSD